MWLKSIEYRDTEVDILPSGIFCGNYHHERNSSIKFIVYDADEPRSFAGTSIYELLRRTEKIIPTCQPLLIILCHNSYMAFVSILMLILQK